MKTSVRRFGFSLIEIMVVMSVIVFLAVFAVPKIIANVAPARANGTHSDALVAALKETQECLRICMLFYKAKDTAPYADYERWTKAVNRAREVTQKSHCANNKRLIRDAIDQWALEKEKDGDQDVTGNEEAIAKYLEGMVMPVCQTSNTAYTIKGTVASHVVKCAAEGVTGHNVD
jgi:prepilin-type N-terminal cleavage/methylation domain-containing protein